MGTVTKLLGGGLLGLGVLGAAFLLSFRFRVTPVLTAIRHLNKRVMNPRQMQTAGEPGSYAGIIEHVGRRSGTTYRTPIGIVRDGDRLLAVLPYGSDTDWVRNVLAAGSAHVTHEGEQFDVTAAAVVTREQLLDQFAENDQRTMRLFGIDEIFVMETAQTAGA